MAGNFLAFLAGNGMLAFGGAIVYFWILNIFNPEYSGFAKGTILFIGGSIAAIWARSRKVVREMLLR